MKKLFNNGGGDLFKSHKLLKISLLILISLSCFYLGRRHSSSSPLPRLFFNPSLSAKPSPKISLSPNLNKAFDLPSLLNQTQIPPPPQQPEAETHPNPPPPPPSVERLGVVDENGTMTDEFEVGEVGNWGSEENVTADEGGGGDDVAAREVVGKFLNCPESMREYIPCLDNEVAIRGLKSMEKGERFERHCPEKGLDCLVPPLKGYKSPIPWPRSRDEVWFSNVPHARLAEDKGGQNWISIDKDKFKFPGGGTQFIHGADKYLDQISELGMYKPPLRLMGHGFVRWKQPLWKQGSGCVHQTLRDPAMRELYALGCPYSITEITGEMVSDITFGNHTRIALDVGCGVASFGAYLLSRDVLTMSVAPKDVHENQIQFALERGVPAMVAAFATRRLLYPSQAFDLVHCSRCRVNWTRDDGILLLEVNRMMRAGGYFVWAAQPVYKHEPLLEQQWEEMTNLTSRMCWNLVKKAGYIAIWQKPLNNTCYLSREAGTLPPLCDSDDDPDNVWYTDLKACISRLPEDGAGANVPSWPARLREPPGRLRSIQMDAYISRRELFKAESKYWSEIIASYVRALHWKKFKMRNVLDMRSGFGGFAAALIEQQLDCWVMNVVPVSGPNTLPVIYDRGLLGVMHDWCEPFDTYPRTYDLLHAAGLFSTEKKRCNVSSIMLEMDRILRPGGRVYIRDSISVMDELQQIGKAMGWHVALRDTSEGPHASYRILTGDKRLVRS